MTKIYLIGSLRNPKVPELAEDLRALGYEVFDDWYAAGPEADDCLRDYYSYRGFSYKETLQSFAAQHIFKFDLHHLDRAEIGVLLMPAGKSGHLELGYLIGQGKPGYILLDEVPKRVDIMQNFATVCFEMEELSEELSRLRQTNK